MNIKNTAILMVFLIISGAAFSQEKPEISLEELTENFNRALDIGNEVLELRNRLPTGMPPADFIREMSDLQRRCEPIIVLIAKTNPSEEVQRYAMHIAMGIKGIELAAWYYIYGIWGNRPEYVNYGDDLLSRSSLELQAAGIILDAER